jgi:hypothetical protein
LDAYGGEDEDEEEGMGKRVKRKSARQMSNAKIADEEAEGSGEEGRYGLRGRKKRMKPERVEPSTNKNQSVVNQQSSTNL